MIEVFIRTTETSWMRAEYFFLGKRSLNEISSLLADFNFQLKNYDFCIDAVAYKISVTRALTKIYFVPKL